MDKNVIAFRVTLKLDEKWASNHSEEDLVEHVKHRLNNVMGFRGQVTRLSVVSSRKKLI